jgi:2-polyprenyl-3-methyl-5-hydroxy-6-metoxy-1,4-benzoquinol methylase
VAAATFMKYTSKHKLIIDRCSGRKVLHLGCVGNNDSDTSHKVNASPSTLHLKLSAISNVTGVDISADAIEEYRRLDICHNIHAGDVEKLSEVGLPNDFEVVVIGDLIEHLSNPGNMLDGVRELCNPDTIVIVTTPHAFGLAPFLRHATGRFREGLQHVMTFNNQNLGNLVNRHGFEILEQGTCYQAESAKGVAFSIGRHFFKAFPKFGGTLYFIMKKAAA